MKETFKAAVISNGIEGLEKYFVSSEKVNYTFLEIIKKFDPDLSDFDLLIVPNGSDHIAMLKIKAQVLTFLNKGKTLFCFDGWFTNWIPENQWIMNNELKSKDVRYFLKDDKKGFFDGVNIDELIFNNNISGWWTCGYIDTNANSLILLEDTWQRPIVVLDEKATNGTIFMTASGPLSDIGQNQKNYMSKDALSVLYQNALNYIISKN